MSLLSKEIERIKNELTDEETKELIKELQFDGYTHFLKPLEQSRDYYMGFADATHQLMQTFTKLLDSGALNGTKTNTSN